MARQTIFFCGIDEFWKKFYDAVDKLGLVYYQQHQNTCEFRAMPANHEPAVLEWLWELRISKHYPTGDDLTDYPAKAGRIIVRPPAIESNTKITNVAISAQDEWLENGVVLKNLELTELAKQFRKLMIKGTIVRKEAVTFSNGVVRNFPIRFTAEALRLQSEGWTFNEGINGDRIIPES